MDRFHSLLSISTCAATPRLDHRFSRRHRRRGRRERRRRRHGRAVQIDPIKPTLTAPKFKLLKPEHEKVLSNYAFKFKLRRYITVAANAFAAVAPAATVETDAGVKAGGGHCRIIYPLISPKCNPYIPHVHPSYTPYTLCTPYTPHIHPTLSCTSNTPLMHPSYTPYTPHVHSACTPQRAPLHFDLLNTAPSPSARRPTGAKAEVWCLLTHAEACLSPSLSPSASLSFSLSLSSPSPRVVRTYEHPP